MPTDDLQQIVAATLAATPDVPAGAALTFQWPWTIAQRGAEHLSGSDGVISGLVSGGNAVLTSPAGPGIVAAIKASPTDPSVTDAVLDDGLFGPALDAVRADQLLRTLFIGFGGGGQGGLVGGAGGSGVAYDVLAPADRTAVSYQQFNLGVGATVSVGLVVGAMSRQPGMLTDDTCVWSFGASMGASVFVQVVMRSDDLSLIGFLVSLGGGVGLASTSGYGSISAG
ncbi:hypothetical protein [Luteimicrobium subarcticum]|uniref:Uncharacterized protein n=1 Tax=Luteimicrobium subarcticum TaxID=620910 RepID=A0A2M8WRW7_9MICO|nr:hypothetical protein [Luteimicrobium subarcticum]PJI93669.1 hypothetical protein CLV34_1143 [Luteimicrobium subarcticum]